jgi:hypothetical protein
VSYYRVYEYADPSRPSWREIADHVRTLSLRIRDVASGEPHVYAVAAVDGHGNESLRSDPVHVTIPRR